MHFLQRFSNTPLGWFQLSHCMDPQLIKHIQSNALLTEVHKNGVHCHWINVNFFKKYWKSRSIESQMQKKQYSTVIMKHDIFTFTIYSGTFQNTGFYPTFNFKAPGSIVLDWLVCASNARWSSKRWIVQAGCTVLHVLKRAFPHFHV